MVQRYTVEQLLVSSKFGQKSYLVDADDYAALEQRFDALSTKFSALVEENATLERERDELRAELQKWCDSRDGMMSLVEKLESENAVLKKQLKPIEDIYGAMKGQNRNEIVS